MKHISKLHFITTNAQMAEAACKGGVDWVQLRLKNVSYDEYRAVALQVQDVCRRYNATFIINDNVQLAADIKADGVHIGKDDMHPAEARAIIGPARIVGCTANTYEDVVRLSALPADYIGLGPYRFTTTKEKLSPVLGLDGYREIVTGAKAANVVTLPLIAIGGIQAADVPSVMGTGMHGIAVSGAIGNAASPKEKAKELVKLVSDPKAAGNSNSGLSALEGIGEIVAVIAEVIADN